MIPLRGGRRGDAGPPNVNLDHPNISETTRARTLKLKAPLDMVKVLALGTFFQLWGVQGRRAPIRQLLVSDIKCFPYEKNSITVYSHTKQKRIKKIFRQHIN